MALGYEFQPVDVRLPDHPRVKSIDRRVRDAALGRYVAGLCYARDHRTGGTLPRGFAEDADPKVVAELVRVGLWLETEGGWAIFNWDAKAGRGTTGAARTRRWREKQQKETPANDARDADVTSPTVTSDVTVTRHSVTDSSSSISSSLSGSDQGGAGGKPPDWFAVEAVEMVRMNAGFEVDQVGARWLEYAASRKRKTWTMSAHDAAGWLTTVIRSERREAAARPKAKGAEATKQPFDENAPWLKLPEVG